MTEQQFFILQLIGRIASAILCYTRADKLNRSQFIWGILGGVFPVISIIIIYIMKPRKLNRMDKLSFARKEKSIFTASM